MGLLSSAAQAQQQVSPDPSRFDFGPLDLGASRTGNMGINNPGDQDVQVALVQDGPQPRFVHLAVPQVTVAAHGSASAAFTYTVPANATPGQHGETVRLVALPPGSTGPPPSGSLQSATAVVFTSTTKAIGVYAIEAPDSVPPGTNLTGRVLVVNTWDQAATVRVNLSLAPSSVGGAVAQADSPPLLIHAGSAAAYNYSFGRLNGAAGNYTLRARLEEPTPPNAPASQAVFDKPVLVGSRQATLFIANASVAPDGTVTVELALRNTGSVSITLHPRLEAVPLGVDASTTVVSTDLDPTRLETGQSTSATGTLFLAAGDYTLRATNHDPMGPPAQVEGDSRTVHVATSSVTEPVPPSTSSGSPPIPPTRGIPLAWWLGGLLALAVVLAAGFLLGRLGRRRKNR
jgi:hypothetical protein